jgi:hypothetical protein
MISGSCKTSAIFGDPPAPPAPPVISQMHYLSFFQEASLWIIFYFKLRNSPTKTYEG